MRRSHDHDVLGDDGSRVQADLAGDRIEHLIVVLLQIEDAVLAERAHRNPGLRIERDELIPERHHEDALVALPVRPVRHTAPRQQARRRRGALAFVDPVHPQQLAGCGIDGHGVASRSDRGIEHAVDHQRGRLEVVVGADAEDIRLESPGDLQLAEVSCVDLIVRDVARASQIAAVGAPLSSLRARLTIDVRGDARHSKEQGDKSPRRNSPKH